MGLVTCELVFRFQWHTYVTQLLHQSCESKLRGWRTTELRGQPGERYAIWLWKAVYGDRVEFHITSLQLQHRRRWKQSGCHRTLCGCQLHRPPGPEF